MSLNRYFSPKMPPLTETNLLYHWLPVNQFPKHIQCISHLRNFRNLVEKNVQSLKLQNIDPTLQRMRPDRQKRRSVESEGTTVATAEAAKERKTVVIAAFVMTNPNSVDLASKNRSVSSDGANLKIPEVAHIWLGSGRRRIGILYFLKRETQEMRKISQKMNLRKMLNHQRGLQEKLQNNLLQLSKTTEAAETKQIQLNPLLARRFGNCSSQGTKRRNCKMTRKTQTMRQNQNQNQNQNQKHQPKD